MLPLKVDDLLPLDEYASRRREFFDSHRRYIDRYRRVRSGRAYPDLRKSPDSVVSRAGNPAHRPVGGILGQVQQELNLYNRLLPGRNLLQAAYSSRLPTKPVSPRKWRPGAISRGSISFCTSGGIISIDAGDLPSGRPLHRHRALGAVPAGRAGSRPARRCDAPGRVRLRQWDLPAPEPQLSEEHRQSLIDDLDLSDRD